MNYFYRFLFISLQCQVSNPGPDTSETRHYHWATFDAKCSLLRISSEIGINFLVIFLFVFKINTCLTLWNKHAIHLGPLTKFDCYFIFCCFVLLWGHIQQCSRFSPGSALNHHFQYAWWVPCQLHEREELYLLYYHFGLTCCSFHEVRKW